jgi:hypothetical protein
MVKESARAVAARAGAVSHELETEPLFPRPGCWMPASVGRKGFDIIAAYTCLQNPMMKSLPAGVLPRPRRSRFAELIAC